MYVKDFREFAVVGDRRGGGDEGGLGRAGTGSALCRDFGECRMPASYFSTSQSGLKSHPPYLPAPHLSKRRLRALSTTTNPNPPLPQVSKQRARLT